MKINDIKPNPVNPRIIKDEKFKKLCQSIKEFPQMMELRPIIVDSDGVILGGNMRYKALQHVGMEEIPGSWVKRANELTEEQKREFVVKDNSGFGEWDWDALANEWDDLPLADWGLDVPEIEELAPEVREDEDNVPDVPEKPVAVEGDVWILGRHRLMCGDSTIMDAVKKLTAGVKAGLLHADPPYGMGKEGDGVANDNLYGVKLDEFQMNWWTTFRIFLEDNASAYIWGNAPDLWRLWYSGGLADSERMTLRNEIVWDKKYGQGMSAEEFRSFPIATERCIFFMLGEQGFNNNADNYWEGWEPIRAYLKTELQKVGDIKWAKRAAGHSEKSGCHWFDSSQWTMPTKEVYQSWKREANGDAFKREYDDLKREFYATRAYFDNTHDNMTDVWEFPRVIGEERHRHATPKPVAMMERVIQSSLPEGGICIEPFGGSGSTLMGAEKTGRTCYTMELKPEYVDVIIKRWQDFTGQKAVHENGKTFNELSNGI